MALSSNNSALTIQQTDHASFTWSYKQWKMYGDADSFTTYDSLKLRIDESDLNGSTQEQIKTRLSLVKHYINNAVYSEALEKIDETIQIITDQHYEGSEYAECLFLKLQIQLRIQSSKNATEATLTALQGHFTDSLNILYERLGDFFIKEFKIARAAHFYQEAYKLSDSLNLKKSQKRLAVVLSELYTWYLSEYNKAEKYYRHVLKNSSMDVDSKHIVSSYYGLGHAYHHQEKFDEAIKAFEEILAYKTEDTDSLNICYTYNCIAHTYSAMGSVDQAVSSAQNAYRYALTLNNSYIIYSSTLIIGNISQEQGKIKEAIKYYEISKEAAINFEDPNSLAEVYHKLAVAYKKRQDFQMALEYWEKYDKCKNSVEADKLAFDKLRHKHLDKKSQHTIAIQQVKLGHLEAEQLLFRKQLKKQNTVMLLSVTILGLLGFILFINRKKNHKISQINENLITSNCQLQNAKERAEILMREVQHRVKNNLMFVASLLDMQSMNLENREARGVINDGKKRIEAMGLLHQNLLYQEEHPIDIKMKTYLTVLVDNILRTVEKERKIKIDIDVENIELEVDKAMPIGLIINELVYNSLKHSLNRTEELTISISLKKEKYLALIVKDNGQGLPDDFHTKKKSSFGIKLLEILSQQLGGKMQISNDQGVRFKLLL
ncbi:tetratricopeptide repeat protein [Fulvivirgaceae bacterium BMA10]|uniref:histidine kinase n=1 Tax=Splendidivirga corallicola TaxID=3051826 RepID=A0ABT8KSI3_9BACT|nr:tetratricopeptide repeat protein [Fulvivirgaceae bacterium BMA10]